MRITIFLAAGAMLASVELAAQQPELIQNVRARAGATLSGSWQTIIDPYDSGYLDHLGRPQANGGFGANKKPASSRDLIEYNFDASPRLRVPGDWNTQRPELMFYEGNLWYKRDFDYGLRPGRRLYLWLGAANRHAIVFLNGVKLGEHEGGFTPFQFEITKLVREKGNFVVVNVDDSRRPETVPAMMTDWWNYGGLTREVRLVDLPETFVEDYSVQLEKGSQNRISGWVRLSGSNLQQPVTLRIPEAGIATTVTPDRTGLAAIAVTARLDLWSPENPKLYDVAIDTSSDRVTDRIGFRSIEASGRNLLLNGKPLHLRGASIHGEAPFRSGRLFSEAEGRTLLRWAKELNCNFVRLAHYPHDEAMVRLADEMGLLVWSEIPVYWTITWENPDTLHNAEQQLTEVITRDKNRAAVILWSVGNETPESPPRLKFLGALAELAHKLDSTRLVTAALQTSYIGPTTITINDPLSQYLDVVSCNEYVGWYDGPPEKIDTIEWRTESDKPFVISEFGADGQAGRHGDKGTIWTEEFQADVYQRQVKMFQRIPSLSGTIAWVLVDFRSPRRPLADIQDFFNRKGLYSDRGERKAAFDVLRDYYESLSSATPPSSK
jgi:beta-glucuronidase